MIRKDTEIFQKIQMKFSELDGAFPSKDLETFLKGISSTINFYRTEIFTELAEDVDTGYCRLPDLSAFSNLEQELFANGIISELITDIGNGIYKLSEKKLENDRHVEFYLRDFFKQSEKQRVQISSEIRYQKNFSRIFNEYGLHNLEDELEGLDTNQEKAEAINKYIFEFEMSQEAKEYLPANILIAKNMLAKLFFDVDSGNGLEKEVEENLKKADDRMDIFNRYGFRLFDYLMKNHLSTGIGRQSDVAFFYRVMNEREKEPFIHVKQTPFKLFVHKEYSGFDVDWKFKGWDDINTEKRRQAYSSSKSAIGLK